MRHVNVLGCAALVAGGLAVGQLVAQENGAGGPVTFSAPFQVLDANGFPMLQIREDNGNPVMELIGKQGQAIRLTTNGDGAAVTVVRSGAQFVRMEIKADESNLIIRSAGQMVSVNATPAHQGLTMATATHSLVELGMTAGKNVALTIYNAMGHLGAQVGADYSGGGSRVSVADSGGNIAGFMMAEGNAEAMIGVNISGAPVATLSTNSSMDGGRLAVFDAAGTTMFLGGVTTEGEGGACVMTNRGARCIEGGFRMFP